MKKTLLTMAAVLALVGCSKSELVETPIQEQNAIAFGTYVGDNAQTRASVVTTETLGVDGFGVNAYYTGTTPFADDAELNFMDNTKVTFNPDKGTDGEWTYSPIKYWPNNSGDMVSFFAYGPYAKNDGDNNITQNGTSLEFVVPAEVKNQVDLIYNTNYEGTINKTKPSVEELIHFQFGHALSRISFTVEAAVDEVVNGNNLLDGNTRINVKKVALVADTDTDPLNPTGPFHTGGTLSLLQADEANPWTSTSTDSQGFVFNATDHFYHTVKDVDAETDNEIDVVQLTRFNASEPQRLLNDDSYLMVIPQENAEFKIYIEYDVISGGYENNGSGTYDESAITNKITSAEALTVTFVKGKAYNFNLVLGMTSVKIDAEVDDWGNEINGGDVWLPENEAQAIQGLGTEENPYEIRSLANLIAMRDNINGNANAAAVPDGGQPWNSAVYKQINDVTVTSTTRAGESWEPISSFSGTYLGNGKKIIGLTINNEDTDNSKYYAWIANNSGTIQDLTMQDVNITSAAKASAIVGSNSGTITNCTVEGSLTSAYVGGLTCSNYGNYGIISDCINRATLSSSNDFGGIACENIDGAKIINCKNYGNGISTSSTEYDSSSQGGIVAMNTAIMENCQNYGNLTGIRVGGIAGTLQNGGATTACYNEGTITGLDNSDSHIGGIAGLTISANIVACYNHGAVIAAEGVNLTYGAGGIAGYNSNTTTIKGCYHNNSGSNSKCGGLLGYNDYRGIIVAEGNYYAGVDAAYGYSASENTDIATKVDDNTVTWETAKTAMNNVLNELYDNGTNPQYDWKYVESTTTPPLTLEACVAEYVAPPMSGKGTAENPYLIYTAEQLKTAADKINENSRDLPEGGEVYWNEANYKLMKDIDLSTVCSETLGTWIPIDNLSGGFDGNNKTIKNLYIYNGEKSDYACGVGLFGDINLENGGKIQNLNVEGSILVDEYVSCVGGIVGRFNYHNHDEDEAPASIENCTFKGTITTEFDGDNSTYKIGGIVGENNYANIINCHTLDGSFIKGFYMTGGIAGKSKGNIIGCSNAADIDINRNKTTASRAAGGILGTTDGSDCFVVGCYNTGDIIAEDWVSGIGAGYLIGCYNVGKITATDTTFGYVGGIMDGFVYNFYSSDELPYGNIAIGCYNLGVVEGESESEGIGAAISGYFSGNNYARCAANYYGGSEVQHTIADDGRGEHEFVAAGITAFDTSDYISAMNVMNSAIANFKDLTAGDSPTYDNPVYIPLDVAKYINSWQYTTEGATAEMPLRLINNTLGIK